MVDFNMVDFKNKYVIAGFAVTVVVIGVGIYLYITRYRNKNSFKPDMEARPAENQDKLYADSPEMVLFYANWCPHCEHMMGDWAEMERAVNGKIIVKKIESEEPEMAKHNISGIPTIRIFPHGITNSSDYVDYKGPRKAQDMIDFVMNGSTKSN